MQALGSYSSLGVVVNDLMNPATAKNRSNLKRKRFAQGSFKKSQEEETGLEETADEKNDELDEVENDYDDESSNSSTSTTRSVCSSTSKASISSSCSSTNSPGLRLVKHGHKMLITEEKMTDALRDFHFYSPTMTENAEEMSMATTTSLPKVKSTQDVEFFNEDDNEDEDSEETQFHDQSNGFTLSDELKSKIKEYNRTAYLCHHNKGSNDTTNVNKCGQMQLVLWSPRAEVIASSSSPRPDEEDEDEDDENDPMCPQSRHHSVSSTTSSSTCSQDSLVTKQSSNLSSNESSQTIMTDDIPTTYRVEEPPGRCSHPNRLKRKYSQLNKINIEEMKPSEWQSSDQDGNKTPTASFYLVDQAGDGALDAQDLAYLNALGANRNTGGGNSNVNNRVVITEITDDSVFDDDFKKAQKSDDDDVQEMEF